MQEIHHDVWIDADRSSVFDAVTTRAGLDSWWGPVVNWGDTVGSIIEFDHGHGEPIKMRVVDLVPGRRVEWENINTFTDPANPASEWGGTRLSFEVSDGRPTGFVTLDAHFTRDPFTILTFRQTGWAEGSRWLAFCNYAWGVTLLGLEQACIPQDSTKTV